MAIPFLRQTTFSTIVSTVGGTSDDWNNTYSNVKELSGNWESTYTTYTNISATYADQEFAVAMGIALS